MPMDNVMLASDATLKNRMRDLEATRNSIGDATWNIIYHASVHAIRDAAARNVIFLGDVHEIRHEVYEATKNATLNTIWDALEEII